MPTTFFGLFLFSLALSLIATFATLAVLKLVRAARSRGEEGSAAGRH